MSKSRNFRLNSAIATLPLVAMAVPAFAQAASDPRNRSANGDQDIIVTAQKVETTLSKTPAALVAVGGKALAEKGVVDARSLGQEVAGVRLATVGAVSNLSVRGIGSTQFSALGGPAVGVSLGGVPLEGSLGLNGAFYDLERVEVLKGPQGTLYGLNATAGVLSIVPRKPELGRYGASISGEIGNYEAYRVETAVNVPIGQIVALRVAAMTRGHDGYFSNGYNDANDKAIRAQLLVEPSNGWSVLLSGDYMHQGGRGSTDAILPFGSLGTSVSDPYDQHFAPDNGEAYQNNEFWGVHAEIKADLGFANLTVIPAYREALHRELAYRTSYRGFNNDPAWQKSLEVRLDGSVGPIDWLVGGYLFKGRRHFDLDSVQAAGAVCAPVPVGVVEEFYDAGCWTLVGIRSTHYKTSKSAFAQLTYHLTETLRLTGGIRYSHDFRRAVQTNYAAKSAPPPFAIFFSGTPPLFSQEVIPNLNSPDPAVVSTISYDTSGTFTSTDYKLGVAWDLAPDTLVYANFATGYKAGGVQDGTGTLYKPERLYSYEAGIRTRLLDDTLRLHLSGFYWDYRNHQEGNVFFIPGVGNVYQITNIPKGHLYGADIELDWRPTPNDNFTAQVAWLESDTGPFNIPVNPAYSTTGQDYVTAPRWTVNLAYGHTFNLGDLELEPRVSTQISSSYNASIFNAADTRQKSFMKSGASLTLRSREAGWSVAAFIRNIEDEAVIVSSTAAPGTRQFWGYLADPRTYGVRASFDF